MIKRLLALIRRPGNHRVIDIPDNGGFGYIRIDTTENKRILTELMPEDEWREIEASALDHAMFPYEEEL